MKQKRQKVKGNQDRITIAFPGELGERLREKARMENTSIGYIVTKAVEKYIGKEGKKDKRES